MSRLRRDFWAKKRERELQARGPREVSGKECESEMLSADLLIYSMLFCLKRDFRAKRREWGLQGGSYKEEVSGKESEWEIWSANMLIYSKLFNDTLLLIASKYVSNLEQ